MKIVSQSTIQKSLTSMEKMGEKEISALVQSFADEQPVVMAYLMAQEEGFSESDFDHLIDLVLIIFLCYKKECGKLRELSVEEVQTMDEKQMDRLESLDAMSEADLEAEMISTMDNAKQPFLLEFITEELVSMEEQKIIEDESGAASFFTPLQLVIDLFDAAANSSFLKIV
jgi:hypothetical protein